MKMYGIHNCDTVRRAKKFLESHSIVFEFVDYRKNPLDKKELLEIVSTVGWDKIINKRSITYRNLEDSVKQQIGIEVLLDNPTLIKRPILVVGSKILVGYNEDEYLKLI
jgi:arsenate reductase